MLIELKKDEEIKRFTVPCRITQVRELIEISNQQGYKIERLQEE